MDDTQIFKKEKELRKILDATVESVKEQNEKEK